MNNRTPARRGERCAECVCPLSIVNQALLELSLLFVSSGGNTTADSWFLDPAVPQLPHVMHSSQSAQPSRPTRSTRQQRQGSQPLSPSLSSIAQIEAAKPAPLVVSPSVAAKVPDPELSGIINQDQITASAEESEESEESEKSEKSDESEELEKSEEIEKAEESDSDFEKRRFLTEGAQVIKRFRDYLCTLCTTRIIKEASQYHPWLMDDLPGQETRSEPRCQCYDRLVAADVQDREDVLNDIAGKGLAAFDKLTNVTTCPSCDTAETEENDEGDDCEIGHTMWECRACDDLLFHSTGGE
ncbi:MAG: hypothetical protein M1818_007404 [Claussenomyces sp. TS43310]|nr:MAG: hypothetical protein M1818_007404 [Claussenomyces sp. TS43310]